MGKLGQAIAGAAILVAAFIIPGPNAILANIGFSFLASTKVTEPDGTVWTAVGKRE